jgi:hypothetical protein
MVYGCILGHGMGFFDNEGVLVAIDGGVDAEGEEVLMVGCHDTGSDDGAVGTESPMSMK